MANKETLIQILQGGEWIDKNGVRYRYNSKEGRFQFLPDGVEWHTITGLNEIPDNLTKVEIKKYVKPFDVIIKNAMERKLIKTGCSNEGEWIGIDLSGNCLNLSYLYNICEKEYADLGEYPDWMIEEREV